MKEVSKPENEFFTDLDLNNKLYLIKEYIVFRDDRNDVSADVYFLMIHPFYVHGFGIVPLVVLD